MKCQAGSVQIKLPLTLELDDRREFIFVSRERQSNKELKVQNKYKSSSKKFLPRPCLYSKALEQSIDRTTNYLLLS